MSYAITVDRVVLGADLRERLAHVIEPQLESVRADEVDQAVERLFDGAAHRREVPVDALAQLKVASSRMLESEAVHMRQHNIAVRARLLLAEAKPDQVEGIAAHLTSAETSAERAKEMWENNKTAHATLKERFKEQLDPKIVQAVRSAFNRQIARGLNGVVAIVDGDAVGAIKFQIGGHVEDDLTGLPNVHVWSVE